MRKQKQETSIDVKHWENALYQNDQEYAILQPKQLQNAIDRVKQTNSSKVVSLGLETLYILAKTQNINHHFYIKQILQSTNYKQLLEHELIILEKKYKNYIRKCNSDKEFINFFINFLEEYLKTSKEDILEYLIRFHQTVKLMQPKSGGQFEIEEEKLTIFLEQLKSYINQQQTELNENQQYLQYQINKYQQQQNILFQEYLEIINVQHQNKAYVWQSDNIFPDTKEFNDQKSFFNQDSKNTYYSLPIEPSIKELISSDESNINTYEGFIFDKQTVDSFLNHHFFILREDCYQGLKKAIQSLKQHNFCKIEPQVFEYIYLYQEVKIQDVEATTTGLHFEISMKLITPFQNQNLSTIKNKILMPGSLIILATQSLSFLIHCQIINCPFTISEGRIIQKNQFIDAPTVQQLKLIQILKQQGENIFAIENKVYYEAYCHHLSCIQKLNSDNLPFQDQIIHMKREIPFRINAKDSYYLYLSSQKQENVMNTFDDSELLDSSQKKAVQQFLSKGIALIQGPPGTGKTHCGALGVKILLENSFSKNLKQMQISDTDQGTENQEKQPNKPILIVCQTNHALDQFLKHILLFCHESHMVRLGGRCKDPALENILFQNYKKSNMVKFDWKVLHKIKDKIHNEAQNVLNLRRAITSIDLQIYFPLLAEKIIYEYLKNENFDFPNINQQSQQTILDFWLKGLEPNLELRNLIIDNEFFCQNKLFCETNFKYFQDQDFASKKELDSIIQSTQILNEQFQSEEDFGEIDSCQEDEIEPGTNYQNKYDQSEPSNPKILDIQNLSQCNKKDDLKTIFKQISDPKIQAWNINKQQREYLITFILNQKFQNEFVNQYYKEYDQELQKLKHASEQDDESYIKGKKIVGVTLTGCAKYMQLLQKIEFNTLLIEEAGEVLESHLISILQKNINHLILIGDHQQLQPHLNCYDLELKFKANISLFERLIKNGFEYVTLQYQRRMKSKFADFIRLIYKDYRDHPTIEMLNERKVNGMQEDLLFFNHISPEEDDESNYSKSNIFEAQMITQFANYLINNGTNESQITILTTYSKQASVIQKMIQCRIRISTIDDYQGEENDIILLSLVRSNNSNTLGFIAIDNRICVAFSRAKIGFYVFGNFQFIQDSIKIYLQKPQQNQKEGTSDLWLQIIELANKKNIIRDHFNLKCQIHNEEILIQDIADWNKYQKGCSKLCEQYFPCGHQCKQVCHQNDHQQIDCREICEKVLDCGHTCKSFCGQKEFKCEVMIQKFIPECQHTIWLKCYQIEMEIYCDQKCTKLLKCGHQCQSKCYFDCENVNLCQIPVTVELDCKHTIIVKCCERNQINKDICIEKCIKQSKCVHSSQKQINTCIMSCGTCLNGLDCICVEDCQKILLCGHQCQNKCYQDCLGCNKLCEYFCNCGVKCQRECQQRCFQCQNQCKLSCSHSKCTKKCYEICDREPCNFRCEKYLSCGCQCMGLCGEQCPQVCMEQKHHNLIVEKDERYYQFECKYNCIYKIDELDQHIKNSCLQVMKCIKCQQNVWSSRRYQTQIKKEQYLFNQQKLNLSEQLDIKLTHLDQIKDQLQFKINYIKNNKLNDQYGFLDSIDKIIQNNLNLINQNNPIQMNFENFYCIQKQLKYYQKSRILQCLETNNQEFIRQVNVLVQYYLLNQSLQQNSSHRLWSQIELKISSLFLFYELDQFLQTRSYQTHENFIQKILQSNFMLSKSDIKDMEEVLYNQNK